MNVSIKYLQPTCTYQEWPPLTYIWPYMLYTAMMHFQYKEATATCMQEQDLIYPHKDQIFGICVPTDIFF